MSTRDGNSFAVADVSRVPALDNAVSATYATAIREGGDVNGKVIGVLGIFFDWETQARGIVQGVRLSPVERTRSRCLLLDSRHRVIASSDGGLELGQAYPLKTNGKENGYLVDGRLTIGYAGRQDTRPIKDLVGSASSNNAIKRGWGACPTCLAVMRKIRIT